MSICAFFMYPHIRGYNIFKLTFLFHCEQITPCKHKYSGIQSKENSLSSNQNWCREKGTFLMIKICWLFTTVTAKSTTQRTEDKRSWKTVRQKKVEIFVWISKLLNLLKTPQAKAAFAGTTCVLPFYISFYQGFHSTVFWLVYYKQMDWLSSWFSACPNNWQKQWKVWLKAWKRRKTLNDCVDMGPDSTYISSPVWFN